MGMADTGLNALNSLADTITPGFDKAVELVDILSIWNKVVNTQDSTGLCFTRHRWDPCCGCWHYRTF